MSASYGLQLSSETIQIPGFSSSSCLLSSGYFGLFIIFIKEWAREKRKGDKKEFTKAFTVTLKELSSDLLFYTLSLTVVIYLITSKM